MESIGAFLPLILIFGVFYILLIRPQQKKVKAHREMLNNLRRGDKIITSGGIIGTINKVANVESAKPPKTTTPIPLYNSDPAPGNITNGTRPNKEVSVDIKIVQKCVNHVFTTGKMVIKFKMVFLYSDIYHAIKILVQLVRKINYMNVLFVMKK